ncbi:hypothetical protein FUSO7_13735 [Fusobacterium necrophorum BFTR-2]|nr:hypothetical protein FUSO7_13735 [Fusobacterium necrophorum BFTR-2]
MSFGTTIVPSTAAKALGATGVVVGTNKFISGAGKVFNGIYGSEIKETLNPIKDGLLKVNPSGEAKNLYDALEVVTEVGVGQLAPYTIGINRNNNRNTNYLINDENYISNLAIPYDGVKKASKYLQDQNIDRIDRQRILKSFNIETLQVKQAGDNQYGIRFYDINYKTKINPAYPNGQYLFETFTPYINRENLALPFSWNEMTGIKQFQIKAGTIIFTGKAAPQFQQGTHYIGGAPQIFVNQPWKYNTLLEINP